MTVADAKKVLDELPDEYDIPALTWLFEEKHPYMVSEDFHEFMNRMDRKKLNIMDIYDELATLGDSQDELGENFLTNLWKCIETIQTTMPPCGAGD